MRKSPSFLLLLFLLPLSLLVSGCMGGSLGQQVARSILMQAADKITWQALEAQRRRDEAQARNIVLKDTVPDEYWAAFVTARFTEPTPQPLHIPERVPATPSATVSRLVPVEIWSFVVGQEKNATLERLRQRGSEIVPSPSVWSNWQLATGGLAGQSGAPLYVLVPPDFGRINSGDRAIVEIASVGGLHVARHRAE